MRMPLSIQDAAQIVANGGGLKIRASAYAPAQLVQLASSAAANNRAPRIDIILDRPMLQQELVQIAASGRGLVQFDVPSARP